MKSDSTLIAPDHIDDPSTMGADTQVSWSICASIVQQWYTSTENSEGRTARNEPDGLYEVRVVHLETGRYLTDEGQPFEGEGSSSHCCEYEQAIERKNLILARLHFVRIKLTHRTTGESEEFTSRQMGVYLREKRRYRSWKSLRGLRRLFAREPDLNLYCPKLDPV